MQTNCKRRSPGFAFWSTLLLVAGVLYVASSGPTRLVARRVVHVSRPDLSHWVNPPPPGAMGVRMRDTSVWWHRLYRPLVMLPHDGLAGRLLRTYWNFFRKDDIDILY